MENVSQDTKKDWLICIVAAILTLWMVFYAPAWFWIPLPFALTYFVKAMRWL